MTPVYKLSASSITGRTTYGSMLAGNPAYEPSVPSFESIATVSVGAGGTGSIDFTSIPSTYKHLQIRFIGRSNRADIDETLQIRINGATSNSYAEHALTGNGSSAYGGGTASTSTVFIGRLAGNNATSGVVGIGVIDILDYTNTNKNRTMRCLTGIDNNGSGWLSLFSGLYTSTTAITSIKLYMGYGTAISQYSHFALYGIKGA